MNVERGEILTVLNKDDPDWFYVVRSDGNEGFVPSAFVYPLTVQQQPQSFSGSQPTYQQIGDEEGDQYRAVGSSNQMVCEFVVSMEMFCFSEHFCYVGCVSLVCCHGGFKTIYYRCFDLL